MTPTSADEAAAARLARALGLQYQVIRLIGRGGFAEVYEVTDSDLQRRLAVKVLRSDLPWGSGTLARFKQEARAIARLSHPNTVPIHFVGEGEGLVYYAMPYLEGRTLADVLRTDGPFTAERALAVIEPILQALHHAHGHGLVHRDVKPDNILLEAGTGRPLLVDFGIVKYLDGPAHTTDVGFIVGTPLYMSPEQALGGSVDGRTDVYGVGAVLFQLLTGGPPFEGNDSQEIVARHVRDPIPVASLSRDGIPRWLSDIVIRCMAKHPDDRYPTAAAVLEALREGRGGVATPVEHTSGASSPFPVPGPVRVADAPTERIPRAGRRRWPWVAGGIAAAVLAALALMPPPEASLVVQNRLQERIALTLDDTALSLSPGASARIAIPHGQPLEAHWAMVQPTSRAGRALGVPVEGVILADRAEGEMRRSVEAGLLGEGWLAPVVTNLTQRTIVPRVVSDRDTFECECALAPGETMSLGYYPATGGSAVLVTDSAGWSGRIGALEAIRDSVTGLAAVPVDSATLRPPHPEPRRQVSRGRRALRAARHVLGPRSPLPVRVIVP